MLRAPGTEPSVLHRKGRAKGGGKSIEEGRRSGVASHVALGSPPLRQRRRSVLAHSSPNVTQAS